jgi:hypothetical protein
MNFVELFNSNYSYFLKEIGYQVITVGNIQDKVDIVVKDNTTFEMLDKTHLQVIVERNVRFEPNIVYELKVSFGAILELKNVSEIERDIDWNQEFKKSNEGLAVIQGLLTRISLQISQITSSYGLNPIVTPPNLID